MKGTAWICLLLTLILALMGAQTLILRQKTQALEAAALAEPEDVTARAMYEHESVIPAMESARKLADALEMKVAKRCWPMPTYADMLFYV